MSDPRFGGLGHSCGTTAAARINRGFGQPVYMARGKGSRLYDVDGHEYIDMCMSMGASLLGHGHPAVCEALRTTLKFPLDPERPDFNLARISAAERLSELEFYFPVQGVSLPRLQGFFAKLGWPPVVPAQIGRMTFDPVSGYLKGFIDLVFGFEGRYYLVDWKSNWLGNRIEDYSPAIIQYRERRQSGCLQAAVLCHGEPAHIAL
jgi:hypothetical protein